MAVDGARRALQGKTRAALLAALRETFEPLAPSLLVYRENAPPPPAKPPGRGPVLAWQHEGFGFGEMESAYHSGRTGRPRRVAGEASWAPVTGSVDGALVRGKRVRLRGWARIDGVNAHGSARLWLRIDGKENGSEFFDNMEGHSIVSTTWKQATIEAPAIGAAARKVAFGGLAVGDGAAFFDDFTLEVARPGATTWTALAIPNPGFEAGEQPDGWAAGAPGYTYRVVPVGRLGGKALQIERRTTTVVEDLFVERPAPGETFDRSLGAGLACRVALGLSATPPRPGAAPPRGGRVPGAEDPAVRAAAVVVAWNVLRHFYPYQDVVGEDWNAVLDDAIADVLDDTGPEELHLTLRRLVHRLHDGHGNVVGPTPRPGFLPIRLARAEGVYVVLAADAASGIQRGDELVSIDRVPIAQLHARQIGLHSGSPQWIDHRLLAWGAVSEGPNGSRATVELRRGGAPRTVTVTRTLVQAPPEFERPAIDKLAGGVFYVDLDRATDAEIDARLPEIAKARGVVFDLRGYPKSSPDWLGHLISSPDRARWMFVPHIIRPDYERVTAFTEHGWDMQPTQPHIAGRVAFVTGPGAISYAESVMGMVEGYRLGAIVGAPTAGANGNINPFAVPGGFRIIFTGMKVMRLDGRQHHLIGVQPTHPVSRTLAGIRAGRDEELEAALALVRQPGRRDRPTE